VSLFILSTAFFSLLGLLSNGYKATVLARDTGIATQLAREWVEQYRKTDYTLLTNVPEVNVTISGVYQGKAYSTTFQRSLTVESALSGSGKLITCTVRWKNNDVWHRVEIRTIVATTTS
jgi:hypothetical protein